MTYILHIETSTKVCSIALSKNGELVQLKEINEDGYVHGEMITLFIQDVVGREQLEMKQLAAISVASGPGSYTGLRIGVSTAKGLCYALGIPLIAIDSLVCLQQIAQSKYPNQSILAMIDARRMEVFSTLFDANGNIVKPLSADVLEDNSYVDYEPFVVIGDGSAKMKESWGDRTITIDALLLSSAVGQVQMAYTKFNKQEFEDVAYFEPFYLKDFVTGVSTKNSLTNL
ncbi:MAG: tRNA (adenosine(37)-N6)-threonylcarbamoyltransferase complex dimerization subunit type 1 TsaB [Crocinitomicaceae bacterium]|nr:tRNA (adenosine(37)-N6)-threonylcarbamoyltransferase complex dimerization subunit type 1 TsaB [Crocinitomicaceae bacterium]